MYLALVEFEKGARIFKTIEVSSGIEKCHRVTKELGGVGKEEEEESLNITIAGHFKCSR